MSIFINWISLNFHVLKIKNNQVINFPHIQFVHDHMILYSLEKQFPGKR